MILTALLQTTWILPVVRRAGVKLKSAPICFSHAAHEPGATREPAKRNLHGFWRAQRSSSRKAEGEGSVRDEPERVKFVMRRCALSAHLFGAAFAGEVRGPGANVLTQSSFFCLCLSNFRAMFA